MTLMVFNEDYTNVSICSKTGKIYKSGKRLIHEDRLKSVKISNLLNLKGIAPKATLKDDYIVSDYIRGLTLSKFTDYLGFDNDLFYAIMKVRKIMHLAGVAHNDLHDDNIIITPKMEVKFIDFDTSQIDDACVINEIRFDVKFFSWVVRLFSEEIEDKFYRYQDLIEKYHCYTNLTTFVNKYYSYWNL